MRIIILLIAGLNILYLHGQVGINTENPKGALHIDGLGNTPASGVIPKVQKSDDLSIHSSSGSMNVGIGTIPEDASGAQLELGGVNSAFLPNRVALLDILDKVTVPDPEDGMIVYNTTTNLAIGLMPGLYSYYGGKWNRILEKDVVSVIEYRDLWVGAATGNGNGTFTPGSHADAYLDPSRCSTMFWMDPATGVRNQQYITLSETGSYAFTFRFYLIQSANGTGRALLYLWAMQGNNTTQANVYDVAELNFPAFAESSVANRRMTATVTLSVTGNKGDQVCFRLGRTTTSGIRYGSPVAAPGQIIGQKTSLIFWKL